MSPNSSSAQLFLHYQLLRLMALLTVGYVGFVASCCVIGSAVLLLVLVLEEASAVV
jgi:hypothetical protein